MSGCAHAGDDRIFGVSGQRRGRRGLFALVATGVLDEPAHDFERKAIQVKKTNHQSLAIL